MAKRKSRATESGKCLTERECLPLIATLPESILSPDYSPTQIQIMADSRVNIKTGTLAYNSKDVQALLEEVEHRSFLRDMTEDEYENLSAAERQNGDLYLLHETDE